MTTILFSEGRNVWATGQDDQGRFAVQVADHASTWATIDAIIENGVSRAGIDAAYVVDDPTVHVPGFAYIDWIDGEVTLTVDSSLSLVAGRYLFSRSIDFMVVD